MKILITLNPEDEGKENIPIDEIRNAVYGLVETMLYNVSQKCSFSVEEVIDADEQIAKDREEDMGFCCGCGVKVEEIIDEMKENQHGCDDEIDGWGTKTICPRCGRCANCDETKP